MKNALVASVEYGNDIKSASKDDKWWWWVVWFDCCNCCNRNCSNSDRRQLLHLTLLTQRIKWYFDIWYFDILILWLLLQLTLLTQRIKLYFIRIDQRGSSLVIWGAELNVLLVLTTPEKVESWLRSFHTRTWLVLACPRAFIFLEIKHLRTFMDQIRQDVRIMWW